MRVTRGKFIRKYLKFYEIVYGLNAPYDVLLDGNFIYHAMKYKIDCKLIKNTAFHLSKEK